jgi:shikimate kinase
MATPASIPQKIFLTGLMGSGKSYWGRQLAAHFKYPFLDLDKGIEKAERLSISEIFTKKGEAYFRETERDILQVLVQHPKFVMSCGGGTPCFFDNLAVMKTQGVVVWLKPSYETLATRLMSGRHKRPALKFADTEELIIERLMEMMEKRKEFYDQSDCIITEEHPTFETFEKALKYA